MTRQARDVSELVGSIAGDARPVNPDLGDLWLPVVMMDDLARALGDVRGPHFFGTQIGTNNVGQFAMIAIGPFQDGTGMWIERLRPEGGNCIVSLVTVGDFQAWVAANFVNTVGTNHLCMSHGGYKRNRAVSANFSGTAGLSRPFNTQIGDGPLFSAFNPLLISGLEAISQPFWIPPGGVLLVQGNGAAATRTIYLEGTLCTPVGVTAEGFIGPPVGHSG